MKILLSLLIMSFVCSCGKGMEEDKNNEDAQEDFSEGTYRAILIPINPKISSGIHGESKIDKYGDDFQVEVKVKSAPKGNLRQYLQNGALCPDRSQDKNKDGYIDEAEALSLAGKKLVPLDSDLSSQNRGNDHNLQGSYHYVESTSYSLMLSDLKLRDLPLERKVIVVYQLQTTKPNTVSGIEIPIACGMLTRISNPPTGDGDWESEEPRTTERPRTSPRRRPPRIDTRPKPPAPIEETPPENSDRWGRWRSRWERWRERIRDWFHRGDEKKFSSASRIQ